MSVLGIVGGATGRLGAVQASGVAARSAPSSVADGVNGFGSRPSAPAPANVEHERLRELISNITRADAAEIIALTQRLEDGPRESASVAMAAYGEASEAMDEPGSMPFGTSDSSFRTI